MRIGYLTDPWEPLLLCTYYPRALVNDALAEQSMMICEETSMSALDLQSEFFVPLEHARDAVRAVAEVASGWSFSSPHSSVGTPVKGLVSMPLSLDASRVMALGSPPPG